MCYVALDDCVGAQALNCFIIKSGLSQDLVGVLTSIRRGVRQGRGRAFESKRLPNNPNVSTRMVVYLGRHLQMLHLWVFKHFIDLVDGTGGYPMLV